MYLYSAAGESMTSFVTHTLVYTFQCITRMVQLTSGVDNIIPTNIL